MVDSKDNSNFVQECIKTQRFPQKDIEKQPILEHITKIFKKDKIYDEPDVNKMLKEFYEDFATIRRELINFGYMQRDPLKGTYWLLKHQLSQEELDKIDNRQKKLQDNNAY